MGRIAGTAGAWAAFAVLSVVLVRQGGFHDTAMYRIEWSLLAGWAVLLLALRITDIRQSGKERLQRDASSENGHTGHPRNAQAGRLRDQHNGMLSGAPGIWLLLIAAAYGLRLVVGPVPASVLGTVHEALRFAAFGAFALALDRLAARDGNFSRRMTTLLHLFGLAAASAAIAGWLGWFGYPSFVMVSGDERLSVLGVRLGGFFQYANACGAFMAALLILQWTAAARAGRPVRAAWTACAAAPAGIALLLTESRGALLAFAAAVILSLALLRGRERAGFAVHAGWSAAISLAGWKIAAAAGPHVWPTAEAALEGMPSGAAIRETLQLAAVCLLAVFGHAAIAVLRQRIGTGVNVRHSRKLDAHPLQTGADDAPMMRGRVRDTRVHARDTRSWFARLMHTRVLRWRSLTAAAAVVLLVCTALIAAEAFRGGGVFSRLLEGRYETASTRLLYYQDGFALFARSPWIGHGGDAWRTLFTAVQSEPYVGSEVHSLYLDQALNLGIAGLALLAGFLASMLLRIIRGDRAGLAPAAVLLAHAAIDFDGSYFFYWLFLIVLCIVYGAGSAQESGAGAAIRGVRTEAGTAGRLVRLVAGILAAALIVTSAAAAWRLDQSRAARIAAAKDSAAREALLRQALEANPAWTRIRLELAPLVPAAERAALLAAGLRWEPQSAPLLWVLGKHYAERGDARAAALTLRQALARDRFNQAKQTEAVTMLAQLAAAARAAGRNADARAAGEAALEQFAVYEALVLSADSQRFVMTEEARAAAAEARAVLRSLGIGVGQSGGGMRQPAAADFEK